ncbi:hypothetical protein BD310DRAFT_950436 [Dichomitus squalens]|uniref:Uncharacterized protein n=1 Tax=Dichomitus squalens TaxID=114155 RepID=A0A4Q9PNP6_9APHY|nr:hypothetical protein BD310DRAFT_950436 [Dichomitus squalens]
MLWRYATILVGLLPTEVATTADPFRLRLIFPFAGRTWGYDEDYASVRRLGSQRWGAYTGVDLSPNAIKGSTSSPKVKTYPSGQRDGPTTSIAASIRPETAWASTGRRPGWTEVEGGVRRIQAHLGCGIGLDPGLRGFTVQEHGPVHLGLLDLIMLDEWDPPIEGGSWGTKCKGCSSGVSNRRNQLELHAISTALPKAAACTCTALGGPLTAAKHPANLFSMSRFQVSTHGELGMSAVSLIDRHRLGPARGSLIFLTVHGARSGEGPEILWSVSHKVYFVSGVRGVIATRRSACCDANYIQVVQAMSPKLDYAPSMSDSLLVTTAHSLSATAASRQNGFGFPPQMPHPTQCEEYVFNWAGGTPPCKLSINRNDFLELVEVVGIPEQELPWTVSAPAGMSISLHLLASSGEHSTGGPLTILPSNNNIGASLVPASDGVSDAWTEFQIRRLVATWTQPLLGHLSFFVQAASHLPLFTLATIINRRPKSSNLSSSAGTGIGVTASLAPPTQTPSTGHRETWNTRAVAGVSAAVVSLVILATGVAIWFCMRRRRRARMETNNIVISGGTPSTSRADRLEMTSWDTTTGRRLRPVTLSSGPFAANTSRELFRVESLSRGSVLRGQ